MKNFKDSFLYPFIRFNRLSYFLFNIIPLFGQLSYIGYLYNVSKHIIMDEVNEPPKYGHFFKNFNKGLLSIVYVFTFSVLLLYLYYFPSIGPYIDAFLIFLFPLFFTHFIHANSVLKGLNIAKVLKTLFMSIGDYFLTWLKFIFLTIFYAILSIPLITLFLTIPAWLLSSIYLFSEFFKYAEIWQANKKTEMEVIGLIDKVQKSNAHDYNTNMANKSPKVSEEKLLHSVLIGPTQEDINSQRRKNELKEEDVLNAITKYQHKK